MGGERERERGRQAHTERMRLLYIIYYTVYITFQAIFFLKVNQNLRDLYRNVICSPSGSDLNSDLHRSL